MCKPGKHKYQARYDERPIPGSLKVEITSRTPNALRRLTILQVYVHDICVKCGDVVKRSPLEEDDML